jgi:hypothetical protein
MNKTVVIGAFFVAAIIAGIVLRLTGRIEGFMQQEIGMPLNEPGMGPYDQVSAGSVSGWSATEGAPILSGGLPSQAAETNQFMFLVENKVDPECCPSAFATDTGCVCLSEHDRGLMASRGGNSA